jgi:hypothetical protein
MGVTLFRVDKGEHVTSVFTVLEEEADDTGTAPEEGIAPDGDVSGGEVRNGGAPDESAGDTGKPDPEEASDD